jgi:hypothetical protein
MIPLIPSTVKPAFLAAFVAAIISSASAESVGWSRASPEYDFIAFAAGYDYDVPVGPWKRSVIAPVDQFNPGHGLGVGVALQGRWFRLGLTVDHTRPDNGEWEAYADDVGFGVNSTSKFWYAGISTGVNPWFTRRVSPYFGILLGFSRPMGKDRSDFHTAAYHFLADGKYSFYVGGEFAAPLRLANQIYLFPTFRYISASKTTYSNHVNHRVNDFLWSVKFEWRVPLSLF